MKKKSKKTMKQKKTPLTFQAFHLCQRLRARLNSRQTDLKKTNRKQVQKFVGLSYKVSQLQRLVDRAERRLARREAKEADLLSPTLKDDQFLRVYRNKDGLFFQIIEGARITADDPPRFKWTNSAKTATLQITGREGFERFPKEDAPMIFAGFIGRIKKALKDL